VLDVLGLQVTLGALAVGALRGLLLGLSAVGIVLVFRSTRVVNLAQGQIGALCAAGLGRLVVDHGVPYAVALPLALAAGALVAVIVDVGIVARLREAPRVVVLVATVGVSQLLVVVTAVLPAVRHSAAHFPAGLTVDLSTARTVFAGPEVMVLATAPAVVVALTLFLALTPTGLAVRASAQNAESASLAGVSPLRVSATVWGLAGALAALAAVLTQAVDRTAVGMTGTGDLGSALLLSTLVAALLGGLTSLPLALVGGVGVGVVVQVLRFSHVGPGAVEGLLFLAALLLVALRTLLDRSPAAEESVTLTRGRVGSPVPTVLRPTWWAPRLGPLSVAALLLAATAVPLLGSSAGTLFLATRVVLFALLGLSLTVLTSWAGQLSLGQVAVYAVGAAVAAKAVAAGAPYPAAFAAAVVVGAALSLLLGLTAPLARGAAFGIVTLALAIALPEVLFDLPGLRGLVGLSIERPSFARTTSSYYLLCLGFLAASLLVVTHLRATGTARRIIGARSNPRRAASLTVGVTGARLTAFGLAGALAGLSGGLFAGLQQQLSPGNFPTLDSLLVVAVVAIGGFGSVSGPLLGALFVVGLPAVYGNSTAADFLTAGIGLLGVLLYVPGGLAALAETARDALLQIVADRRPPPAPAAPGAGRPATPATVRARPAEPPIAAGPVLAAAGIRLAFGGRVVLDGVDLALAPGEVLGLIGANGAGKSTLLAVLSGELIPSAGRVWLNGRDATGAPPAARAAAGLGRVFQDATLFGDLTTTETVLLALEAREPSELVPSLLGLPPSRTAERAKRAAVVDVLHLLGLGRYAALPVSRLSTGTRRLVELACLLAQDARVLLLDEPTAGLAQREVEAFGPLLRQLRADLGASIVLVEHDLPLVSGVSDRLQCLGEGRTLATGSAAHVLAEPAVRASYLGDRAARTTSPAGSPTADPVSPAPGVLAGR